MFQIGLKKFLWLKKLKYCAWTYVISDLKGEGIVGTFYGKELQKTNWKEYRVQKVIKRKGDKIYVKGQATIVILTVALIKTHSINEWIFSWTEIFRRNDANRIRFI